MKLFNRKDKLEYEFLPSALEVEETPPPPLGRIVIWLIFVLIIVVLVWSYFAKEDKVAVARGKIIPTGRACVIEPMSEGIVKKILIEEGQSVKKGQLLVELDPTISQSEVSDLKETLSAFKLEHYLRNLNLKYQEEKDFSSLRANKDYDGLSDTVINFNIQLQNSELNEYNEKISTQEHIVTQARAEHQIALTQLSKLQSQLATLSEEEQMMDGLAQKGSVSRNDWLKKKSEVDSLKHDVSVQQSEIERSSFKIKEAEHKLLVTKKEWITNNLSRMVELEKKIGTAEMQLVRASKKLELENLYSPVNGIVNQMEVTTEGEIVEPAKAIITIVPDDMILAEVMVLNKDIGFIKNQQSVEMKLDTFPFQKYGILGGTVINISPDAIIDEKTGNLMYKVKIKPDTYTITIDGKIVPILPGMSLTAEIKTGTRRIIEFFLDPITKFKDEGFKLR